MKEFEVEGKNAIIESTFQEIDANNDNYIQKEELFIHIKEA